MIRDTNKQQTVSVTKNIIESDVPSSFYIFRIGIPFYEKWTAGNAMLIHTIHL